MKYLLITVFVALTSIVRAQKIETKRIVQIKGTDTTIILINEQMDKMDSILTEEMKKIYTSDTVVRRVDVYLDSSTVFVDGQDTKDSIKVKIGNMKIIILQDRMGDKKMIIDERVIIQKDDNEMEFDLEDSDTSMDEREAKTSNPVWSGIAINANGLLNAQNKLASGSELGFLALDRAKSIGIQWNVCEKRFPIIKDYLGVTTGLGMQWNRYALKGNYDIISTNDTIFGVENTSIQYTKNLLSSVYLQAPLLLQINTNKKPSESLTISAGIIGGIRVAGMHKSKWEVDGKQNKDKTKDEFNFRPFQASLIAIVGYGNWNLYMTYNLTDVFNDGATQSLRGVNAGLLRSF